ncbi:hypothetical protein GCM10009550_37750 [Actinocorallia libanotica]|uniref:(d)CMP kinase n=1 Tax=Actinocorallia libanotica TaxID=46162 RepID=A0ABN1RBH1_9ACTN
MQVMAVDGPSAAGKSTYAARLAAALDAPLLGTDEFPVPWDGPVLAWWPHVRPLLETLRRGGTAVYRPYDWRTRAYGPPRVLRPAPLLVLEGVGTAWRGGPADLRIWVDAPYGVRRRRAVLRDGAEGLAAWEEWGRREAAHFARDRTRERADLVVDSGDPPGASAELARDLLQRGGQDLGGLGA